MKPLDMKRALLAAGCFISLAAGACLDVSPAPTEGTLQLPTITPTLIPTNTPLPEATVTPTSTATATPTATGTATPTQVPFTSGGGAGAPGGSGAPGGAGGPGGSGGSTTVIVPPPPNINQAPSTSLTPAPPGTTLPPILVNTPGAPGTTIGASPDWGCDGDERMEFVPPGPRAGDKLFIFVTSARDRQFGLIIGPQLSGVQGANVQGGAGLKKQWELTPAKSGRYEYHFYGGPYPEHLCVSATVEVGEAASTAPLVTPTATATPTRTPTALPPPRPDH